MKPLISLPLRYGLLAALALGLRVAYVWTMGSDGIQPGTDGVGYDTFARMMLAGWDWVTTPWALREPLYPAFMALGYTLPGNDFMGLVALQVLLGTALPLILYWGLRPHVRESIAMGAALLGALNPHFIFQVVLPLRENLIIPLLALVMVLLLRSGFNRGWKNDLWLAIVWAFLIHADSRYLPFMVILPLVLWCTSGSLKSSAAGTTRTLFLVLVLLVPYTVRGYVAFGKPVVLTERFLDRFVPLFAQRLSGEETRPTGVSAGEWMEAWEEEKTKTLLSLSQPERDLYDSGARPATQGIQIPVFYFREYWRFARSQYEYEVYPYGRLLRPWSQLHNVASAMVVIPFLLALPWAVFSDGENREKRVFWAMVILIGVHCLMHVTTHAIERYRFPVELCTGVITIMGLVRTFHFFRNPRLGVIQTLLK